MYILCIIYTVNDSFSCRSKSISLSLSFSLLFHITIIACPFPFYGVTFQDHVNRLIN